MRNTWATLPVMVARSTTSGGSAVVRTGGHVVFEVRDPSRAPWRSWNRSETHARTEVPAVGVVESWVDLLDVALPLVPFRWTFRFEASGQVITSDSTLRFPHRDGVERSVAHSGLVVVDVRDAPDRPGLEHVFVCATTPVSDHG